MSQSCRVFMIYSRDIFLRAGAALIWAEEEEVGWVGDPGREEGEKVAEQAL